MGVSPMRCRGILPLPNRKTGGETPPGRMGKMPMPLAVPFGRVLRELRPFVQAAEVAAQRL